MGIALLAPLLTLLVAACSDSTGPTVGAPEFVEKISRDGRSARVASALTEPVRIRVTDGQGRRVPGIIVLWTPSGGGSVTPELSTTNSEGVATTIWTLGAAAGFQTLTAEIPGTGGAIFIAEGRAGPPESASVEGGDGQEGERGQPLADSLRLSVQDAHGNRIGGVAVEWRVVEGSGSVHPAQGATGPDGLAATLWTLGEELGEQQVVADVEGLSSLTFQATGTPAPPATLDAVGGQDQTGTPSDPLPDSLVLRALDEEGRPVEGLDVSWTVEGGGGSVSPTRSVTDEVGRTASGWTLGPEEGQQRVRASARGMELTFHAIAEGTDPDPASVPQIHSVSPALLLPGGTATITGDHFAPDPEDNRVLVAGTAVSVTAASGTSLEVALPGRRAFPCRATGPATVEVRAGAGVGSLEHPLSVPQQLSLAPGEAATVLEAEDVTCNELEAGSGRYLVSVFNTGRTPGGSVAFELHGPGSGAAVAAESVPVQADRTAHRSSTPPRITEVWLSGSAAGPSTSSPEDHLWLLERNREILERLGPLPTAAPAPIEPETVSGQLAGTPPEEGDVFTFRVPDADGNNLCSSYVEVEARAVWVGERGVVFEDVEAPLAGTVDEELAFVGRELDDLQFEIVSESFGNPLAMNDQTNGHGHIYMLFTHRVNDFERNITGFVFSGDFFTRAQCAASDRSEVFYARVPTVPGTGFQENTPEQWLRTMRGTVVHEVKHISSFAERLSRNASSFEEVWLEEGTARAAEELWAREVFGYGSGDRTGYRESLYCELHPSRTECEGAPLGVRPHFFDLYQYLGSIERLSPVSNFTLDPQGLFYASAWHLTRWMADHFADSDADLYRALNQEPELTGVPNLEARTGRSFPELLAEWSLALAAESRGGAEPLDPRLRILSWDMTDIFQGMNEDFPSDFPRAAPLEPRQVTSSEFVEEVGELRAGTASLFEVSGGGPDPRLLELRGSGGGLPSGSLRLAVLRVE